MIRLLAPVALAALLIACNGKDMANAESSDTNGASSTGAGTSSSDASTGAAATSTGAGTGTTGAGTGTGTSAAATDATTCSFIDCNTTGNSPTQCDPGLQDCPEGEKCSPYVMTPGDCCVDALKCVPDMGDKQFGEKCNRTEDNDDCDVGLFCMTKTSGSTGEGICLPLCSIEDPGTCPQGECIAFNDGFLPLCEVACDPLTQDCIGDGVGCYAVLANDKFICASSGYEDGKGNDGDDCYTIQSCKPGLVCIDGAVQEGCVTERCCTPVCDVSMGGVECMSPMEECVSPWAQGEAPPEYQDVGLCTIPG